MALAGSRYWHMRHLERGATFLGPFDSWVLTTSWRAELCVDTHDRADAGRLPIGTLLASVYPIQIFFRFSPGKHRGICFYQGNFMVNYPRNCLIMVKSLVNGGCLFLSRVGVVMRKRCSASTLPQRKQVQRTRQKVWWEKGFRKKETEQKN